MNKKEIFAFIEKYCDEYREGDNVELIMDNHKCIVYYGKEYYIPENNSFWSEYEQKIQEHLIKNYLYE